MTRINSDIVPKELCDRMLIAEHREIKRVPNNVKRKFANGKLNLEKQPKDFKLGTGHEIFFYDKLAYLHNRYKDLREECLLRGFEISDFNESFQDLPPHLYNDWKPSSNVREILVKRINERLDGMRDKDIRFFSMEADREQIKLTVNREKVHFTELFRLEGLNGVSLEYNGKK